MRPGARPVLFRLAPLLPLALVAVLAAVNCAPHPVGRPNVLVLIMDTTRGDRCSFMGYDRPTTPRLDAFAREATVFENAWSPACWTGPAHASLFTGLRPEHHGFVTGNRFWLREEPPTLAGLMSAAGYSTGCFSCNQWFWPMFGLTRGFVTVETQTPELDPIYPWATRTHDHAANWAEGEWRAGRPFLLFVNDLEAHLPYTPSVDLQGSFLPADVTPAETAAGRAYAANDIQQLAFSSGAADLTPRNQKLLSDLYDAEIATLDREIGVLLDRFRSSGLLDSTIVVIAADHGELLGEHHLWSHGLTLSRAETHVPLLVRWPDAFGSGEKVESVARLEDLMPTILSLCGVPVPAGLDGAPLARKDDGRIARQFHGVATDDAEMVGIARRNGWSVAPFKLGSSAVCDGRYHYVESTDGTSELYDVAHDQQELVNLVATHPDEVARLASLLHAK